jgi:hypothetical protein
MVLFHNHQPLKQSTEKLFLNDTEGCSFENSVTGYTQSSSANTFNYLWPSKTSEHEKDK